MAKSPDKLHKLDKIVLAVVVIVGISFFEKVDAGHTVPKKIDQITAMAPEGK